METTTIPIKGMHCASCARIIEDTLQESEGVELCEVNFGTEKVKIKFDSEKTNIQELSGKIEPYGYSLTFQEIPNSKGQNGTHTMPDGTVMSDHEHMDHSAHLGLNQSKQEKLKELNQKRREIRFILPISIIVFVAMIWSILGDNIQDFPKFPLAMQIYNPIAFIFATIALFWIGRPFIQGVIRFVKYRIANMDTLVGLGTLTAYIYSTIVVLFPQIVSSLNLPENTYFDVTIIVIGFISFGKYLEARSKLQTGEAIEKLIGLQAKTALVIRDGKELEVLIENVRINDIVIVKPGGKIPVDGVIIEGSSTVDESMITGESIPIDKTMNDTVIGGTINKQGAFKFKATKVGSETLLSHIIKMVEEAQGSRAPIQRLADQISGIFVPVVLIIAVITLISWIVIGSQFMPLNQAFSLGLVNFVGILVIACPCALGLATPTAIIVGTGKGAQNGILIKDAESLEKLHKVNVIVTDKTGTITKGEPEFNDIHILQGSDLFEHTDLTNLSMLNQRELAFQIISSIENKSEHPIAQAIVSEAKKRGIEFLRVDNFKNIEGKGIEADVYIPRIEKSVQFYVGSYKMVKELNSGQLYNDFTKKISGTIIEKKLKEYFEEGKTIFVLATDKDILAVITVADALKSNAKETVEQLHKLGIKVVMLTGDNEKTANYIAKQAGIDKVFAEVLPQDKALVIKNLQDAKPITHSTKHVVAMLGDGVNDAPALAQADIGIAMATGTDVAIESASITLLKGDFSKVLKAIKLSKVTMRTIKQNLFWAFIYNIIGIPIAAGLLYPFFGISLNPAFAGMAMAFSSVSVVANSLRLKFMQL